MWWSLILATYRYHRSKAIGCQERSVPAPTPHQQDILLKLGILLYEFVEEYRLGKIYCAPCDVILSQEDIVQPDIFFIAKERKHIITERNIQGALDLVVEILSPFTTKLDRTLKTGIYQSFGVKEYWLVDPERREIEILTHKEDKYESLGVYGADQSFESSSLKGLRVKPWEIF